MILPENEWIVRRIDILAPLGIMEESCIRADISELNRKGRMLGNQL